MAELDEATEEMRAVDETSSGVGTEGSDETAGRETPTEETVVHDDLDPDCIFQMQDIAQKLQTDVEFCAIKRKDNGDLSKTAFYCVICQVSIDGLDLLFRHFNHFWHCTRMLDLVEKKKLRWQEGSYFDYLDNFLKTTEKPFYCFACACDINVCNTSGAIGAHIKEEIHKEKLNSIREENRLNLVPRLVKDNLVDWYEVDKYFCAYCDLEYRTEYEFVNHIGSGIHDDISKNANPSYQQSTQHFCSICSMFWYGEYLGHDHQAPTSQPQIHLRPSEFKDQVNGIWQKRTTTFNEKLFLVRKRVKFHLEETIAINFPAATTSFREPNANILLDLGLDMENLSDEVLCSLRSTVERCMGEKKDWWRSICYDTNVGSISIQAHHKITRRDIEIIFADAIEVTTDELLRSLMEVNYLLHNAVKKTETLLNCCKRHFKDDNDFDFILLTTIFYMQSKLKFSRISDLIEYQNGNPHFRFDWEFKVNKSCANLYSPLEGDWTFQIEYCKFYANFDYQHDVICPWIGKIVKKRDFVNGHLPKKMFPQVDSKVPHLGEFDAPFCIQDLFGRFRNLTKTVSKAKLRAFRRFCHIIVECYSESEK